MTKIAIVYFSGYGHTARQAEAVQRGVEGAGTEALIVRIPQDGEVPTETLEAIGSADAIIYGSPTYMGGVPWQFKRFADASSKTWFGQSWKDKLAAGFTNSASLNGDKFSTMTYFWTLSQQHGQLWVGPGLLPSNKLASTNEDTNWAGGFGGAYAISPSDSSPEQAPFAGDLETARILGERVATFAARLAQKS
ncbi:flavodoxin family protein [Agrobacterium sp. SORGH_AS 787]|uniref:flavodoxin family protein n=1 Tax=Agrobacterium sp. SORGH_AS 787 TaxID=3041775 RepID=UPI002788665B|nr:NAD(P)H dehydrogenase (quinone) [Rhizobium sp. SORGH_AS_0787]